MIINTLAMNCQPPGAIHPQKFQSLTLYHRFQGFSVIAPGQGCNVFAAVIDPGSKEYFTLIFPDCRPLGVSEPGIYEAVKPSGWVRPFVMLSSPLCTGTGDALKQLLEVAGIKYEDLRLVERFYP
jgi:hypothetical protein